jgi:hypothetical protein
LPWKKYNNNAIVSGNNVCYEPYKDWFFIAKEVHLFWNSLGYGGRCLHARNVGIVEKVKFIIALPNLSNGGGTVMGMRLAAKNGINVYNLRDKKVREEWENLVL